MRQTDIEEFKQSWGRLGRGEPRKWDSLAGLLRDFSSCLSFHELKTEDRGPSCSSIKVKTGLPFYEDDMAILFAVRQQDDAEGDDLYTFMTECVYDLHLSDAPIPVLVLRMPEEMSKRCTDSSLKFVLINHEQAVRVICSDQPRQEFERIVENYGVTPHTCPFVTEGAVSGKLFHGRKEEIKLITQQRGSGGGLMRSYAIIGPLKSGKTSLLHKIKHEIEAHFTNMSATYISLKGHCTANEAIEDIILRVNPQGWRKWTLGKFERLMQGPHGRAEDHIWLLDECDNVIQDDLKTGEHLCQALTNSQYNRVVFAGHTQLRRITATYSSALWNAVTKIDLYGLDRASAKDLFQDTFMTHGWQMKKPEVVLNHVVNESNCLPVIVQLYGAATWKYVSDQGRRVITPDDVLEAERMLMFKEKTIEAILQDANPLARLVALLMTKDNNQVMTEREICLAIEGMGINLRMPDVIEAIHYLEHTGLLKLDGSAYCLAYSAFPRLLRSLHEPGFLLGETIKELKTKR